MMRLLNNATNGNVNDDNDDAGGDNNKKYYDDGNDDHDVDDVDGNIDEDSHDD